MLRDWISHDGATFVIRRGFFRSPDAGSRAAAKKAPRERG